MSITYHPEYDKGSENLKLAGYLVALMTIKVNDIVSMSSSPLIMKKGWRKMMTVRINGFISQN